MPPGRRTRSGTASAGCGCRTSPSASGLPAVPTPTRRAEDDAVRSKQRCRERVGCRRGGGSRRPRIRRAPRAEPSPSAPSARIGTQSPPARRVGPVTRTMFAVRSGVYGRHARDAHVRPRTARPAQRADAGPAPTARLRRGRDARSRGAGTASPSRGGGAERIALPARPPPVTSAAPRHCSSVPRPPSASATPTTPTSPTIATTRARRRVSR